MIPFDQLDTLTDPILELYERYIQSVLNDIARRLGGMDYSSSMAAWQMQRMIESGKVYENAIKELSKITGKSEAELRRLFQKAGVKATKFDDAIYAAAGLKPLPLNLSPEMAQVLAAGLRKTHGIVRNLTMTTAISAQNAFIDAADLAYMQVSSGAFDYISAIRNAIKEVASKGLPVINYASGRKDQLDVAVRRTVLTGVSQTVGNLQLTRAQEMGQDLVAVSAHIGARNVGEGPENHESWQGQVYSISGTHPKYKPFVETTGYGTAVGLHGINCRHSFYPFFEGISEAAYSQAELDSYANRTVIYNGKEMSVYEATQYQRGLERKIRYWKRQEGALKAAVQDTEYETGKVKQWQGEMRDFVKQMNTQYEKEGIRWYRQYEREKIVIVPAIFREPKLDFFDWEVKSLRQTITNSVEEIDKDAYKTVLVPKNVHDKLFKKHSKDIDYLLKLGSLINLRDYIGISPKGLDRIEFYKKLDDIWFTAVVKKDRKLQAYILTTFHRIYQRKMESRIGMGYLSTKQ